MTWTGESDLAEMLLVVGADKNQGDDVEDRPLHYSARYGKLSNYIIYHYTYTCFNE